MVRKIKPFDMEYKDFIVRVTRIRNYKETIFRFTQNIYEFDLVLKRNGERHEILKQKLQAMDLQDFKLQLRLILIQSNF